eukprot:TRINITY_DN121227_c0_g1_i1.p1 TRINITY_DN121227_c0_g1~~TRINITY_DN121227_c0_g1_i1.p1  ORF type:complete len:805 (+),score=221.32 TRINITY_DN121227_c0_g1_i1:108-2522(+)
MAEDEPAASRATARRGSAPPVRRGSACLHQFVTVPGFNINVMRDDGDAQMVLVFTRSSEVGGTVDMEEMVEEPLEMAKLIFVTVRNEASENTMKTGFEKLQNGPVKRSVYQEVIRNNIKDLFRDHGFFCVTEKSLDNDEIEMKVLLDENGETLKGFANNIDYSLPLNMKAYAKLKTKGEWYKGGAAPKNILGDDIFAHVPFDFQKSEDGVLQPFRRVDVIRLLMCHMDDWINLQEAISQNVLSRFFYVSSYEDLMSLHDNWCDLKRCVHLPSYEEDHLVRDYFGEQLAFLFNWIAFFVRSLFVLGVVGVVVFLVRRVPPITRALGITFEMRNHIKLAYVGFAVIWAVSFTENFKAITARRNQKWGMDNPRNSETPLLSYDPHLEGTSTLMWCRRMHNIVWGGYMLLFVIGVAVIQAYEAHQKDNEGLDVAPLILAGYMKAMQWVWSKIAPKLVYMQNWRTEAQWYDSLTFSLSTINIFIGLWPGLNSLFIQKFVTMRCGSSKEAVLKAVYKDAFPANTPGLKNTSWVDPFFLDMGKEFCLYGCYPETCEIVGTDNVLTCKTNCYDEFQTSLQTFFVVQVALTFVFAVTPIIIVRLLIWREQGKVESGKPYTLLQVEAKREEVAPYIYKSWGGSYEEDWNDMSVAFAVLVCFSPPVLPVMSFVGFICFAVIYRLLAFRTSLITSRPYPTAMNGIGLWQRVIDTTVLVAVVTNCALVAFVCVPFRDWPPESQVLLFLFLENTCVFLKQMLSGMLSNDEPWDVRLARLVNEDAMRRFQTYESLKLPEEEKFGSQQAGESLGLAPKPG